MTAMELCVAWPLSPDTPLPYQEFWKLWQEEEFFLCHEVLEILWRETSNPDKLFYNGLIHCAVAIYQHRRGNAYGAARQLCRAKVKLGFFRPHFRQVRINCLIRVVGDEIAPSLAMLTLSERNSNRLLERELETEIRSRIDRNFLQEFKG